MKKLLLIIVGLSVTSSVVLTNIKFVQKEVAASWPRSDFEQLYVLGDSLSDTGALVGLVSQILSEVSQEERTLILEDPFYQHRSFSNGKLAATLLAEKLNLPLAPAWEFHFLGNDFKQEGEGNNYAFAGAQASDVKGTEGVLLNNFSINKQVDALLSQHQLKANDLTFFEIGSNDLMFQILNPHTLDQKDEVIKATVKNQHDALEKLINHGSKRILVMNSPDLGSTPSYDDRKEEAAQVTAEYTQAWNIMISNLQKIYPHTLKVFDLYHEFPQLLANFAGNITQGAVSYDLDFNAILEDGKITPRYNDNVTPETINQYFFFDFIHPTALVHQNVGELLYQIATSDW